MIRAIITTIGALFTVFAAVLLVLVVIIGGAAAMSLLMAFPLKWTWNYVVPGLFGLATIEWGQAWCLMWVTSSLVGVGACARARQEFKQAVGGWLAKREENKPLRKELKDCKERLTWLRKDKERLRERVAELSGPAMECGAVKIALNRLLDEKESR